jgi:hypothetical protein
MKLTILLASQALLSACAQIEKPAPIAAGDLCRSWRHQTISKDDQITDRTAQQIEGSNKARPAWGCVYGENRAKGGSNG